ncbi:MAG: penicillin-binding protein [Oscillospiraceae bacterium]|nr:penicillin-binding protein [Oscillospiraceae bacterium]
MKKVKRRAWAALVIALAVALGMCVYVCRFANEHDQWVSFSANQHIYSGGALTIGTVTDRNGVELAGSADGARTYAADAATRIACLHAVGDTGGNIGTGALTAFANRLAGYSVVGGVSGTGGTVTLSIDERLNRVAYEALAGRSGAVLLCDYTTGELLCMVSSPSYDPLVGFDADNSYYDGVYLNRALSAAYAPGSVFKLVTLAAALENIDDLYARSFVCTGSTEVDGNTITCSGVHGAQTIEQALANSCNCAFAELSLELGGGTLEAYAARFGLTESQSINGIATAAGSFEAAADGSAELAWSGIGQSTDLVCPVTFLRYVSAIANGGVAAGQSLLSGEGGGGDRLLSADTADKLRSMMNYNVVYAYGTDRFPGLTLCAKSGTAEVGDGSSHAWFAGFLDDTEHPYAFVVVVEHGGGGLSNAGPVANAVLQAAVAG